MQPDPKKAEELLVATLVAEALGGVARLAELDPPDAYLDVPGEPEPIPLEVVRAYPWPSGQPPDPQGGAPAARATAEKDRDIAALLRAGAPGVFAIIRDSREAVVVPAEPGAAARLRLAMERLEPREWLIEAVRPKCAKPYAPGTILAVDFRYPYPPDADDLAALGAFVAQEGRAFRSVWVCYYGRAAHLAPFPSARS
jgi:hypothetical protein